MVKDSKGNTLQVGDTVSASGLKAVIAYIGKIECDCYKTKYDGGEDNSIWADYGMGKNNGLLAPNSDGGCLTYMDPKYLTKDSEYVGS